MIVATVYIVVFNIMCCCKAQRPACIKILNISDDAVPSQQC